MKQNLRLYTFVNYYLRSIQQGIQTAHVVSNLFMKYGMVNTLLHDWAMDDKTIIVLNGGNNDGVKSIMSTFTEHAPGLKLPFECFYEDDQSLGGIMTSVGIVLPEVMYLAQKVRYTPTGFECKPGTFAYTNASGSVTYYDPDTPEAKLLSVVKSCGMAS